MKKRIQSGLFGLACAVCGWLAGHYGYVQTSAQATPKGVTNLSGQVLRVRAVDEPRFTDKSKKFGLELYRDENNGNIIYISETGSIAVLPSK